MSSYDDVLQESTNHFQHIRRFLLVFLWFLVIVAIIAYIFQIWNAVASIRMLQTSSPTDEFKANNATYQQYKNLAIGNVVMSTLEFITILILLGAIYSYANTTKRIFLLVKQDDTPTTKVPTPLHPQQPKGITIFT